MADDGELMTRVGTKYVEYIITGLFATLVMYPHVGLYQRMLIPAILKNDHLTEAKLSLVHYGQRPAPTRYHRKCNNFTVQRR